PGARQGCTPRPRAPARRAGDGPRRGRGGELAPPTRGGPGHRAGALIRPARGRTTQRSAPRRAGWAYVGADVTRSGEGALPGGPEREPVDVHLDPVGQRGREAQLEGDGRVRQRADLGEGRVHRRRRTATGGAGDEADAVHAATRLPRAHVHGRRPARDQDLVHHRSHDLDLEEHRVVALGSRGPRDVGTRGQRAREHEEQRGTYTHRGSWKQPPAVTERPVATPRRRASEARLTSAGTPRRRRRVNRPARTPSSPAAPRSCPTTPG